MQALQDTLLFCSFIIISHVNLPTLKNDRFVYQSQQQVDLCSGHKKSNKTCGGREIADFFFFSKQNVVMKNLSKHFMENMSRYVTKKLLFS